MRAAVEFLLALSSRVAAQEAPLEVDRPVTIELAAPSDAAPAGEQRRAFAFSSSAAGHLFVCVDSESLDPTVRVEDASGALLGTDEDSGGNRAACLRIDVGSADRLRIVIDWKTADRPGTLRIALHLAPLPTPEESKVVEQAQAMSAEALQLAREKEFEPARQRVHAAIQQVTALDRCGELLEAVQVLKESGKLSFGLGGVDAARDAFERVLRFEERFLNPDHPALQQTRVNCAEVRYESGDFHAALLAASGALESRLRTLPEDDVDVQAARMEVANAMLQLGDSKRCLDMMLRVVEVLSRKLPDDSPSLQTARQNLSNAFFERGDLLSARELDEKVLAARERTQPEESIQLQQARTNLASTLFSLGDHARSRQLREKVLEVTLRILPEDHREVRNARSGVANCLAEVGEYSQARKLDEEILAVDERQIRANKLSPDDPAHLIVMQSLGEACRYDGDLPRARELFEEVLARGIKRGASDFKVQDARINLAVVANYQKDFDRARGLIDDAVQFDRARVPRDPAATASIAATAAFFHLERGEPEVALPFVSELADSVRDRAVTILANSSAREAEAGALLLQADVSRVLTLARELRGVDATRSLDEEGFALVETLRGIGLRASQLARSAGRMKEGAALRERLRAACEEVARLANSDSSRDKLLAATTARDAAQRELIRAFSGGRDVEENEPTAAHVAARLSVGTVAVSFAFYESWSFAPDLPKGFRGVQSVVAFVLRRDRPLARVELGALSDLDLAIAEWLAAIGASSGPGYDRGAGLVRGGLADPEPVERAGSALRRALIEPLLPKLDGARRILLVPDGPLLFIPFDALATGDRFEFETRASLWELLLDPRPSEESREFLLAGGVDYDAAPPDGSEGSERRLGMAATVARRSAAEARFVPLPGTKREVDNIAAIVAMSPDVHVLELAGAEASGGRIVELAPRARVLHLATHGFVSRVAVEEPRNAIGNALPAEFVSSRAEQVGALSPLALCGLALSGANLPADACGRNRNILTAEEISALDLERCEVAVLSACDTGLGILRPGQGAASLQRALQMAGARCAITSLWSVPDDATCDFMVDFYRRALVDRETVMDAFTHARRDLRDRRDESGRPVWGIRSWAGFVLTGDGDRARLVIPTGS